MPIALPSLPNDRDTPAISKARLIASRLLAIGVRLPFSKSRTVDSDTLARWAKSSCDQSSQPRAARLCSGVNMLRSIAPKYFSSTSTKGVDLLHINGYNLSQRFSLTDLRLVSALSPFRRRPIAKPSDRCAHVGRRSAANLQGHSLVR